MRILNFILTILLIIGINGCISNETSSTETNIDSNSLKGKFILVKDNKRAGIEGILNLISDIEFRNEHCHFTYATAKMSGKFSVDEGYVYIYTGSDLGTLSLEIVNNDHLEGEGFIHGTFKREGTFVPEKNEKNNTSINNQTNKKKQVTYPIENYEENEVENKESIETSSNNPFGSENNSTNKDNNLSYGNGSGPSVTVSDESRTRLNNPSLDHIITDENVTIGLKLTINADGTVVSAISTSKTTTTDQRIINQVISAVKSQVKYNKSPGANLSTQFLNLKIVAE